MTKILKEKRIGEDGEILPEVVVQRRQLRERMRAVSVNGVSVNGASVNDGSVNSVVDSAAGSNTPQTPTAPVPIVNSSNTPIVTVNFEISYILINIFNRQHSTHLLKL